MVKLFLILSQVLFKRWRFREWRICIQYEHASLNQIKGVIYIYSKSLRETVSIDTLSTL